MEQTPMQKLADLELEVRAIAIAAAAAKSWRQHGLAQQFAALGERKIAEMNAALAATA